MCLAGLSLLARCAAVVGNSTLDFNYYGPVEEYATYVKSRPACYIDEDNPGTTCFDALLLASNPSPRRRLYNKPQDRQNVHWEPSNLITRWTAAWADMMLYINDVQSCLQARRSLERRRPAWQQPTSR